MILKNAADKLNRFNQYCLHYNIVADAAYEKLRQVDSPFSIEYRPFIIAALISFDMARMMGKGRRQKYDPSIEGFASKLDRKMKEIQPLLEPFTGLCIDNLEVGNGLPGIKTSYKILASKSPNGLHNEKKYFHVGATKILHFINPEFFPIVDSNSAKTLRKLHDLPYRKSAQPGYSADLYLKVILKIRDIITRYGIDDFRQPEPVAPIMRIFDKLTFAYGNGW